MADRYAFSLADASRPRLLAGRYEMRERLAVGGMAEVWRGVDHTLHRDVAIKMLKGSLAADDVAVRRFRHEAQAVSKLNHSSIVQVFDTVHDGMCNAIVMELVPGSSLRDRLDQQGPLMVREAVRIGRSVAAALDVAHRAGVLHRDIKPANILLHPSGRVVLTDFGIAKAMDGGEDLTSEHLMMGTAKYLAPEQVTGDPMDGRADLYSLGIVLYESLAGQVPFAAANDTATALARLQRLPVPLSSVRPDVPSDLERLIGSCLARVPDDRPPNGRALATALDRVGSATATTAGALGAATPPRPSGLAAPAPVPAPVVSGGRRRRALLAGLVLGAAGAALLVAAVVAPGGPTVPASVTLDAVGPATGGAPIAIAKVDVFDPPPGDGQENGDALTALVDADPTTAWSTERYSLRNWEKKNGVGVVLDFDEAHALRTVTVETPDEGWAASIYLSDGSHATLDQRGEPSAEGHELARTATFDLGGRSARFVLVWFTSLGRRPSERHQLAVDGIAVHG